MTLVFSYKSTDKVLAAAVQTHFKSRAAIEAEAFTFAHMFGKEGEVKCYFANIPKFQFKGLAWPRGKGPKKPELWTKPLERNGFIIRPIATGQAAAALRKKYNENFPKLDGVNHSDWSQLVGMPQNFWKVPGVFVHPDGSTYIQYSDQLTSPLLTEILPSQWVKAHAQLEESEKAKTK